MIWSALHGNMQRAKAGAWSNEPSLNTRNFQNVPKDLGNDYFDLPFPVMRSYLLPEEGHVWVCGDFKNQEPRLTAHYEDDAFKRAFIENPLLDPYMFVANMCSIERHPAKQILLGLIYAMGAASLADKIGCSLEQANIYRNIVKSQLAGVVELDQDCKRRFKKGLPIKTLGGRLYYCEPPSNGRTWDYKALNTLIQGSAADQCKQSLIYMDVAMNSSRYQQFGGIFETMVEETFRKWGESSVRELEASGARLLGTVHDEISLSCRAEHVDLINEIMQSAANNLVCDVPMIMDIDSGPNWSEAKP